VLFRLPQDAPFAFAGLWESWRGGDGATLETCTILSTAAHGAMTRFHHRVPMTVPEPERARWLDASEDMRDFVARPVFEDFLATRVTTHVNAVRNDDAGCVAPAVEEEEIAGKKVKNSYNDKQGSLF
jgi:putative SOS response-associated peptidase YedK